MTKKKPPEHTMRYSATRTSWVVNGINENTPATVARGLHGEEPEWLRNILTVARIGGHCMDIPRPPPDLIVWFRVNDEFELLGFVHH
jgi:hypothetical protein